MRRYCLGGARTRWMRGAAARTSCVRDACLAPRCCRVKSMALVAQLLPAMQKMKSLESCAEENADRVTRNQQRPDDHPTPTALAQFAI